MSTYTIDTATSRATPTPAPGKRLTAPAILARKGGEPIVALTAYTMRMAQLLDPHCDLLLVGDSLGQVIYGLPSTIPVSLEMMCAHGAAVVRGSWHALVAVDMPFGSYEESPAVAFRNAARIMKETGCGAIKLEGGARMAETIRFLVERGVPVMAHIGLTPPSINVLGGFKTQGRVRDEWATIEADARAVAEAGALLEALAEELARRITAAVPSGRVLDEQAGSIISTTRSRAHRPAGVSIAWSLRIAWMWQATPVMATRASGSSCMTVRRAPR